MTFKERKIEEYKAKKTIKQLYPDMPDTSGIYILTRRENGIKYAYIGQAKKILTRLAEHLNGYQHIDFSLRKHGLFNSDNENGYIINYLEFGEEELDKQEQRFIKEYANAGFQLRNKTAGGQAEGKVLIDEIKPARGYHDGLKQGYKNAKKFVGHLFKKNLKCTYQGEKAPTKNQQKAMQKFNDFLQEEDA